MIHAKQKLLGVSLTRQLILVCLTGSLAPISPTMADPFQDGESLYRENCESCHGPDGRGTQAWVPDFYRDGKLNQPDGVLAETIQFGKNAMPGFMARLSPAQVDAVIYYLRMTF